jgi:hypothetical protein
MMEERRRRRRHCFSLPYFSAPSLLFFFFFSSFECVCVRENASTYSVNRTKLDSNIYTKKTQSEKKKERKNRSRLMLPCHFE